MWSDSQHSLRLHLSSFPHLHIQCTSIAFKTLIFHLRQSVFGLLLHFVLFFFSLSCFNLSKHKSKNPLSTDSPCSYILSRGGLDGCVNQNFRSKPLFKSCLFFPRHMHICIDTMAKENTLNQSSKFIQCIVLMQAPCTSKFLAENSIRREANC